MSKPRLLNVFSGSVCSAGYRRAGFHVTDVDLYPMPRHQGDVFIQADAIDYLATHGHEYDAIHASPLCQPHSEARRLAKDNAREYYDYIPITRWLLESIGLPYVIENVEGARKALRNPIMLCGSQFGLKTYRHRLFESNIFLFEIPHYPHDDNCPPAGRGRSAKGFISITSGGITGVSQDERRAAMGVDWYVTNAELSQSIPPAFTEYIGRQLMQYVTNKHSYPESEFSIWQK